MLSNEASDYVYRRLDLSPLPAARQQQQQQQAETTDEGSLVFLPVYFCSIFMLRNWLNNMSAATCNL
ncbi:hypothetical protein T05_15709 [Trichinella murrelli]|uniref:Uncharacterized protein n=1 Tax=Trichinella murrelli TaxID=144512 RepID=A0A0V0T9J3_9BILA|nr:hypothetical protein T05_15709 [Trichinella murrelli]